MRNLTLSLFLFSAIFTAPQTSVAGTVKTGSPAPTVRSKFESILELQVRLDRAHFSPGEIDGKDGSNLKRAITAFARARKIRVKAVPTALAADVEPVLVAYSISAEDAAGPFVEIPEDMMEKAGMNALGYKSVLEALGEKFHASPALLETLNPGVVFDVPGTSIQVPNVHAQPPEGKATRVVVDRSDASVSAYDAKGKLVARYPATMGSSHDPLPLGKWKIQGVSRNPTFNYNPALFWDAEEGHAKAKIPAGPNNPVGVVWIDLSKPHYGIHGTPEPSTIGKTQSHGCIRLTNWDATELAAMIGPGVSAVLQR